MPRATRASGGRGGAARRLRQAGEPAHDVTIEVVSLVVQRHRSIEWLATNNDVGDFWDYGQAVERRMRLDEATVGLRVEARIHPLNGRNTVIKPGRKLSDRGRQFSRLKNQ